jgi:hypothetical protein
LKSLSRGAEKEVEHDPYAGFFAGIHSPLDIPEPVPSLEKLEDIVIRMVGAEVDSIASRLFH